MLKFLSGFLFMFFMLDAAFALPPIGDTEKRLNTGTFNYVPDQLGIQLIENRIITLKCQYDFSKQGGAVATYNLKAMDGADCKLPNKALVMQATIDVITAGVTPSSGTIAIGTGVAINDIKTATAAASITGVLDGVPNWAAANKVKTAAVVTPSMTIATGKITAGKFNVFISYLLSN